MDIVYDMLYIYMNALNEKYISFIIIDRISFALPAEGVIYILSRPI